MHKGLNYREEGLHGLELRLEGARLVSCRLKKKMKKKEKKEGVFWGHGFGVFLGWWWVFGFGSLTRLWWMVEGIGEWVWYVWFEVKKSEGMNE